MQAKVPLCEVNIKGKIYICGLTITALMWRNLGVQVYSSLKVANKEYASIGQGVEYKSQRVLMQLYRTLVHPHLEYCINVKSINYICNSALVPVTSLHYKACTFPCPVLLVVTITHLFQYRRQCIILTQSDICVSRPTSN